MKIHFCDLCNESVPQAALDSGAARSVKGRVICAACEAAMSHGARPDELDAAHAFRAQPAPFERGAQPGSGAPALSATVPSSTTPSATTAGAPALALPAAEAPARAPALIAPTAAAPAAAEPASQTGIAWVAGIALAFTALSIFVTDDRLARVDRAQGDFAAGLAERDAAIGGLSAELNKVHPALAGVEARGAARLDAAAQELAAARASVAALEGDVRGLGARFETLASELAALRARLDEPGLGVALERRLDEFSARLARAEDERRALGERLAAAEQAAAAEPATVVVAEPAVEPPAWLRYLPDLEHADESVRWDAVSALGESGDPAVVPRVIAMLADESFIVRMAAARVLGEKLRAREAVPALIATLEDADSAVRESAWIALRVITGKDLEFESGAPPAERAKRAKAWAEWWKKEVARDAAKPPSTP